MTRPFFSTHERRALVGGLRNIAGSVLVLLGVALALSLLSHDPADPGYYSDTWRKPANWLGGSGALIADILIRTIGLASYGLAAIAIGWGVRMLTNNPPSNAIRRGFVAPFALIIGAAFASAHATEASVGGGLGGLIGDFIFGVLASGLPFESAKIRLVVATLGLAALLTPMVVFALGGRLWDLWSVAGVGLRNLLGARRLAPDWARALGRFWSTVKRVADFLIAAITLRPDEPATATAGAPLARAPSAPRDEAGFSFSNWLHRSGEAGEKRREPAFKRKAQRTPVEPDIDATDDDRDDYLSRDAGAHFSAIDDELDERQSRDRRGQRMAEPEPDYEEQDYGYGEEDDYDDEPFVAVDPRRAETVRHAYQPPSLELLTAPSERDRAGQTEEALAQAADQLQRVLQDYGVKGDIVDVHPGPVVSQFELEPAPGLKASRVIGLADDIARSMSATAARISTVPGRNVIGIELPNPEREIVRFRELLAHPSYVEGDYALPLALGKDIGGEPIVADLARMPHLLIAGTTGSGKSVGINTMLLSLLYRLSPDQVRLLLIDPKMLELSVYNDAPHLLTPVVTDPKKAVAALKWVVREMESRYQKMARLNVRSLDSYNQRVTEAQARGETLERTVQTGFDEATGEPIYETQELDTKPMPYIVVVIDEMADLMLVAGKEIELCVQRLAQMARASGIHLIMATQRPSVDVITGVIKANFPIRISFQVTSKIDSRTILGEQGAEQLLGKGDMLFAAGGGRVQRIHGPFVADDEVEAVSKHLSRQGRPDFQVDFDEPETLAAEGGDADEGDGGNGDDALYKRALSVVLNERRASTSLVQRRLQIGYNRAARIIEMLESNGVISPANHVGKREVLRQSDDLTG